MRLDHLSFAAGPDGLISTAERIGCALLGCEFLWRAPSIAAPAT
jgi:hypothetical protein